jgi:predicted ATPase
VRPEALRLQGVLLQTMGKLDQAEDSFQRALDVARAQKAKWWELRAATHYARLLAERSRRAEARAVLQPIDDWFTEGHDTRNLRDAAALLDELKGKEA